MPNTFSAAAEGLPKINRRTALAGVGVAAAATLSGVAQQAKASEPVSAGLRTILEEYQSAWEVLSKAFERHAAISESLRETASDALNPRWVDKRYGLLFRSEQQVINWLATFPPLDLDDLAKAYAGDEDALNLHVRSVEAGREERIQRAERIIEYFGKQEQILEDSGYNAAEDAIDAGSKRLNEAFRKLREYPCETIEEVRAKADLLLNANPSFGGELEYSEAQDLLRSFLGRA